jgi:rod shape-determining protein MreC
VVGTMFNGVDAAQQNITLQQQVLQLQGQLAQQDVLQQQVQFYRAAADIRDRTGTEPIEAGIFSYPQQDGIREVIIDRGTADWVAPGNTVATPEGALVGTIADATQHSATVLMVGDPAFQVAARVMGTTVSGLVRVDSAGDIVLDLVQKDEMVTEGSMVITSGDDNRPAGLMIGTVRSVDNTATTLFKVVRIAPVVSNAPMGRVLIIRP